MRDRPLLRLETRPGSAAYTSTANARNKEFLLPPRDRAAHASRIRQELFAAEAQGQQRREAEGLFPDSGGDVLSVSSHPGFELKLDSLERRQSGIELLSARLDGNVVVANVYVPAGKYVRLLSLLSDYLTKDDLRSGMPRHKKLVESIESVKLAALRDLWQDKTPFPQESELLWWEVWLRRFHPDPGSTFGEFSALAAAAGLRASEQYVTFPERVVVLVWGTAAQIGRSLPLLSRTAELRRAKELAGDYVGLPPRAQRQVIDELLARVVPPRVEAPSVCLLDTGVNREHPLLSHSLSADDMHSLRPGWGTAGGVQRHGTEMAGIALYGCLTEAFTRPGVLRLGHRLESVRLIPPGAKGNDPPDFGPLTLQAVARAEIAAPRRSRAVCLAATCDARDAGAPTLWSGAVDQLCSGGDDERTRLVFVSAGNLGQLFVDDGYRYFESNCGEGAGVEDPGQAWNAVTVGAYTERVFTTDPTQRGKAPLAPLGGLCPTSRTSLAWPERDRRLWPYKPDLVMEGGNLAVVDGRPDRVDDLCLLTTTLSPVGGALLTTTSDTSPATALAARMAAMIWSRYPRLRPETVRALMVHSARWTPAMLERFPGESRSAVRNRLRCFGYGVPDLERALWCAGNEATLIFEGEINPFVKPAGEAVRTREMHLHRLPWPQELLLSLGPADVTMRVTLSYFIEPSPGQRGWTQKHRYASHGLRFDVKRPLETDRAFVDRLSKAEWEDDGPAEGAEETRRWVIGEQSRTRGSLHSDAWPGSAADLALCDRLAVFPVKGWWSERPHLQRFESKSRYSLIISIEAPKVEVDLHAAIETLTQVETVVEIDS